MLILIVPKYDSKCTETGEPIIKGTVCAWDTELRKVYSVISKRFLEEKPQFPKFKYQSNDKDKFRKYKTREEKEQKEAADDMAKFYGADRVVDFGDGDGIGADELGEDYFDD